MEQNLVKSGIKLPGIINEAYDSIQKMNEFADLLLDSQLVPDHFYEKGADRKPDYKKGKRSSVVVVLLQAQQLNLPPMTALQHIVPVNGLLSVKGELAMTMIFGSGKLKANSWKEVESGSEETGDYTVSITATRSDNGATLTRSFGINDAKRAGLWIDSSKIQGQDGWKYKQSAWWKYWKRMCKFRALGFLAKDLFSDVLMNTITTEEAMDYPTDQSITIPTVSGAEIKIPDKAFSQERSQKITSKASELIDKKNPTQTTSGLKKEADQFLADRNMVNEIPSEARKYPVTLEEAIPVKQEPEGLQPPYTEQQLMVSPTDELMKIIDGDMEMAEARDMIEGKNTNKKLRTIILAKQMGKLDQLMPEDVTEETPEETGEKGIQANAGFDNEAPDQDDQITDVDFEEAPRENSLGIEIHEVQEGEDKRPFEQINEIYMALTNYGINNTKFKEVIDGTPELENLKQYKNREEFCGKASVSEINNLLKHVN